MTDIMHESDFRPYLPTTNGPKHVRTYGSALPRPAFDATPDLRCSNFGHNQCIGLCPRHQPALWSEHMAKHVAGESL